MEPSSAVLRSLSRAPGSVVEVARATGLDEMTVGAELYRLARNGRAVVRDDRYHLLAPLVLDGLARGPQSAPELSSRLGVADNLVRAELVRLHGECRVFEHEGSWRLVELLPGAAHRTRPLTDALGRLSGKVA